MRIPGRATLAGTVRFAARALTAMQAVAAGGASSPSVSSDGGFRLALGLCLSSIGFGTYQGEASDEVDACYREALGLAIRLGCNVLDTAPNYRGQRSEIVLGQAVADLIAAGQVARDELVIASKGGYIAYRLTRPADPVQYIYDTLVAPGIVDPDDLAGGIHCLAPDFLSHQISSSLRNMGLRTLDIYYLHDPETQLAFVDRATFRKRLQLAFARLEEEVAAGRIGCYGVATWEGLRRPPVSQDYLNLEEMVRLAREVAGSQHHFRVVQFPLNPLMLEGVTLRNQPVGDGLLPSLTAARELGLTVIVSAAAMQGQRPARTLNILQQAFPTLESDIQRALQFTRSLPGVTTALVGMTCPDHVRENLALLGQPGAAEKAEWVARALAR